MTLDKHQIDGVEKFTSTTLPAEQFEQIMTQAGYSISGTASGQGGRHKVWWSHASHRRVESVYSPDKKTVITAYHPL